MLEPKRILSLITPRFLELIILPTEQCNFRCTYCYEDFSIGKMSVETVNAIKLLITNRFSDLDTLKISWFGGEPLIARDIIFDISAHILALKQRYPQVNYISGITTNAFQLKENLLRKLIHCGISTYQVSLDGTEAVHNKTRVRINATGSFREIWHNLLAARDSDLQFSMLLRVHVTPDNVLDLYELIDHIKGAFGYDSRFSIFFKAIENLGGKNTFNVLYGKNKTEILAKLYELVGDTLTVKKINAHEPYVCYAAQANSFLIRADGKVGKCTVSFNDDRNVIGQLAPDGTIHIASDKLNLWTRGIITQNESELSCPLYQMPKIPSRLENIAVVVK